MPLYADVHASTSNTPPWRMHEFVRNVHVVYLEMYINMYSMYVCLNNAHEHTCKHICCVLIRTQVRSPELLWKKVVCAPAQSILLPHPAPYDLPLPYLLRPIDLVASRSHYETKNKVAMYAGCTARTTSSARLNSCVNSASITPPRFSPCLVHPSHRPSAEGESTENKKKEKQKNRNEKNRGV
jgi:hypothetical protein